MSYIHTKDLVLQKVVSAKDFYTLPNPHNFLTIVVPKPT